MSADIFPFPKPTPTPAPPQQGMRQSQRDRMMIQNREPLSPAQKAAFIAKAMARTAKPRPWNAEDHAAHVASVVRIAIRSARRRGVRIESMLSIPRRWLLDLCEQGDPTCLVVHDWLMGNLAYLPEGFEDTFSATTANKEDA
jgi:hypothetical protein